jgi:hypothetical protein
MITHHLKLQYGMKNGEWITQDIVPNPNGGEVAGWVSRENIDEIISIIKSK